MKKLIFLLLTISVLNTKRSEAQSPNTLPFIEAVKIALNKNVNFNVQKNQLSANQAFRVQSYSAFLPAITANAGIGKYIGPGTNPDNGDLITQESYSSNGSISANLVLFNGFSRVNTLLRYENQVLAQASLIERSKQDAIFNTANQYLLVLLDQELLRIAEENLISQKSQLEQIKGFVDVGVRPQADLYNQDAQVKIFEVSVFRAKVTLQNDKSILAQSLQLDPSVDFIVEVPNLSMDNSFIQNNSLEKLYEIALNNRADFKQADYQIGANKYALKSFNSGYLPSLSVSAQRGSQYSSLLVGRFGVFNEQFPTLAYTQYSANINIPIFDRLVTRTNRVNARVTYRNSVLTRDNLEKTIKIDVQRNYNNYFTAIDNLKATQAQFEAADLALRTQQESYNLGIANQVTLALANQTFTQARASRTQAEVTLLFQRILLDYALGTLNPDTLVNN